jgi:DNA-binding NarL/FixJ family response regulator
MKSTARILVADDLPLVRKTIRSLLALHSFRVCGEAVNGKEAIEKTVELSPDIVLMDINMPDMNGVHAAIEIRRIAPRTRIVFLTAHHIPGVERATRVWARGFVRKADAGTHLLPLLQDLTAEL